jgi:prolycopene isomerase
MNKRAQEMNLSETPSYDAIVIGAGIGGLGCAAKLAAAGRKVLVLEKDNHIGGTSYIFRRNGYGFPMGPLSFSFPWKVMEFLGDVGVDKEIRFQRNHFELITPDFEIICSQPLDELQESLKALFPAEAEGFREFFPLLKQIIRETSEIWARRPEYFSGRKRRDEAAPADGPDRDKLERIRKWSDTPCAAILDGYFSNAAVKNFLGSQGTSPPEMSLLNLGFMWKIMSEEGIWFPDCGIHGLNDLLQKSLIRRGGEIRLNSAVKEILVENGRAHAIVTEKDEAIPCRWIVSNADYKKTFLELIDPRRIPADFVDDVKSSPYTGSELCVYLGIDPKKADLSRLRATHVFFRRRLQSERDLEPVDFDGREVEICLWSENAPGLVPERKASLVVRVGLPYGLFSAFRLGEKRRTIGYQDYKRQLAHNLIHAVESLVPDLSSAAEVMEIATPLTYEDWGHRTGGSIAGWSWSAGDKKMPGGRLLIETPVENLLMAGIYASTELFLGGVPTSLYTAGAAADLILEKD